MIKDIILNVSRSYTPYVPVSEIWGAGQTLAGELDNNFNSRKFLPVDNGTNWEIITQMQNTSLAIKSDGTLWSWGSSNFIGSLGQNDNVNRSSPTQIGALTWVSASAGGSTTPFFNVIRNDGTLWTWGSNTNGQLGLGDNITRSSPTQLGTRTWKKILGSGDSHTMAVSSDDYVWGWGGSPVDLGVDEGAGKFGIMNRVSGPWNSIAVNRSFTIAVNGDGKLYSWGLNTSGQLGTGDTVYRSSPVQIGTLNTWVSASSQYDSLATMAIRSDNTLWGWGYNINGKLGLNNTINRSSPTQIGTDTNWLDVSIGANHTLAIKTDGTLWGWGGSNVSYTGTLVAGVFRLKQMDNNSNWVSASFNGNSQNAMTLKTDGTMWLWGSNSSGQLGFNDTVNRSSPVQLGTRTWKKISSGQTAFSSAIRDDNTMWTWGNNGNLSLGLIDSINRSSPVQVGTMTWNDVASGLAHSIAIRSDGTLWAWGENGLGSLGQNNTISRNSPVQIGTLATWSKVSTKNRTAFAIANDGTLWGWGPNGSGQLGINNTINRSSPVQVGTNTWNNVYTGGTTTLAIRSDGTLWGWGDNTIGVIGDGTSISKSSPVQIGTETNWVYAAPTAQGLSGTSIAIKTDNTLWAWGRVLVKDDIDTGGNVGISSPIQIGVGVNWQYVANPGDGSSTMYAISTSNTMYTGPGLNPLFSIWTGNMLRSSPVQIGTETNWAKIYANGSNSAGIKTDGTLWGWGAASYGFPVINKSYFYVDSPVQIGTDIWSKFSLGSSQNYLAIKTDGTLWAWGSNQLGDIGLGDTIARSSPVQVGTRTWNEISAGYLYSLAIRSDNTLWGWGYNNRSQLGIGNTTNYSSPVQVGLYSDWYRIYAGDEHSVGIRTSWNYDMYTAGTGITFNVTHEAINGWTYPRKLPIIISQTNPWNVLSVGPVNSVGIKTDGTLWVWGQNSFGQLGLSDTISRSSPVQVGTKNDWMDVTAGRNFTMALSTNSILWAWGNNGSGQLGDNTGISKSSPVQIGTRTWNKIRALENSNALAVRTDGTLWTWGANSIGLGVTGLNVSPVQVGTDTDWLETQSVVDYGPAKPVFVRKNNKSLYVFSSGAELSNTGISFYKSSPVQVTSTRTWKSVHAGTSFTIAISNSGSIWGWGDRTNGVLGDNASTPQYQESPVQIGTLTTWVSASAGNGHVLSVRTDGTMWGWGLNTTGQLGLNNTTTVSSPVQIGTLTNWKDISAGRSHTMAIKSDGTMWGWGTNNNNQIGNASGISHSSPVQVGTLTWKTVSAGVIHSAAIRNDNTLWTWGNNVAGQLGTGNVTSTNSPVQVGTRTWTDVAAGPSMTMAVRSDGTLWTWGVNTAGQLGLLIDRSRPNYVIPSTLFTDTKAYSQIALGLSTDGTLWGWGTNSTGQLGLGDTVNRSSPVQIGTSTWSNFSPGAFHVNAIKTDGTLWGWGYNLSGALGLNLSTTSHRSSPVQVGTDTNWRNVDGGYQYSIAVKQDGTLWAWGNNSTMGSLGDGTMIDRSSPVQIGTLNNWSRAFVGYFHSHAIKTDGTLWGWGYNNFGGLGTGNTTSISSPVQIGTRTWLTVADKAGYQLGNYIHSLAIRSDGTLWSWGSSIYGELGLAIDMTIPRAVNTSVKFVDAKVGQQHGIAISTNGTMWMWGGTSFNQYTPQSIISPVQIGTRTWSKIYAHQSFSGAIRSDGTLWMWGTGTSGQLGQNNTSTFNSPVQVGTRADWYSMKTGRLHTMAIRSDGTLWGWGSAQLGDSITIPRSSPVQIGTDTNWSYVSPGEDITFGLKTDGTLWSWGLNTSGQLGLNDIVNRSSPVQIGTETNWTKISDVYTHHAFAIKNNGTLWAWGTNFLGHLGLNDSIGRSSPVQIGTRTDWKDVFAGYEFSMAIRNDGTLWAWGTNTNGQLGIGDLINRSSPVQVGTLNTWVSASLGLQNTVLLLNDGTALTTGTGTQAEGIDTNFNVNRSSPVQIGTRTDWISAALGDYTSMAIRSDGTLWSWGLNTSAQLGLGDVVNRSSPVQVGTLSNWVSASFGQANSVLLQNNGYVLTTGIYALGFDTTSATINRSSPVQIGIDTNWQKVKATVAVHPSVTNGGQFMAQKTDGTLWSWGQNTFGNLGDGTLVGRSSPVQIGNETSWVDFSAEGFHFVGIKRY